MSTCNSVNLVKGSGLKTILSFCNNTQKVLQNNAAIISLTSVPELLPEAALAADKWAGGQNLSLLLLLMRHGIGPQKWRMLPHSAHFFNLASLIHQKRMHFSKQW